MKIFGFGGVYAELVEVIRFKLKFDAINGI